MNNPTWTPWLKNPGTGQSPVPGWAHECEVQFRSRNQGIAYPEQWCWLDFGSRTSITHYRYAVPEDLADLAQAEPEYKLRHYEGETVCYSRLTPGTWESCHPNSSLAKEPDAWTNHDRDRARQDLGYTTPAERNEGETVPEPDPVNHPDHYQSDNGIECIDAIRAALGRDGFISYCRGNAIKYAWRADRKGKAAEDKRKASWYLERAAQEEDDQ